MNRPETFDAFCQPGDKCAFCDAEDFIPGAMLTVTWSEGGFGPREQVYCNTECAERAFAEHGCDREREVTR